MSDVQALDSTTEPAKDPTLGARRVVAFILSFALGFGVVGAGIILILHTGLGASFPMAFIPNVPLLPMAGLPAGFFFLIWVDFFMGTKILPD